jgi:4-diphosphocytidyl-2-C-methyl-D-erythritol kinase
MILTEIANAKVNLSLRILGKRPDGYHELESLVAFAEIGDELRMDFDRPAGFKIEGPFAAELTGHDNLVLRALSAVGPSRHLKPAQITLDKRLPVAAGIGGGSADAAATLRLIRKAFDDHPSATDWMEIAVSLGADVPVCFVNRLSFMRGIGECVEPLPPIAALPALLVNPLTSTPVNKTAAVFKALSASPLPTIPHRSSLPIWTAEISAREIIDTLVLKANDLEIPARKVMPVVGTVLDALCDLPGVRIVRLSGAGPTCFALFDTREDAQAALDILARVQPHWWIAATVLR